MKRNFMRWSWSGAGWRCSECGAEATDAVHVDGDGNERERPYNMNQETCSPRCALARKNRLQRERRAAKKQQQRRRRR